jgi:hypothetical protein
MNVYAINVASLDSKFVWKQVSDDDFYVSAVFDCQISYLPFSLFGLQYPVRLTSSLLLDQLSHTFHMTLNAKQKQVKELGIALHVVWPETSVNVFRIVTSNAIVPFSATTEVIFRDKVVFGADTAFTVVRNNGIYTVIQDFGTIRILNGDYLNGDWNIGGIVSDTGSLCDLTMNSTLVIPTVSTPGKVWDVESMVKYRDGLYGFRVMDIYVNTGVNISGTYYYSGVIGQSW